MLFNSPQEGCYVLHGYSRVQILEPMAQSEFVFHGDWAGLRFLLGVKYTICVGTSSTETQVQVFSVSFLIFFFFMKCSCHKHVATTFKFAQCEALWHDHP